MAREHGAESRRVGDQHTRWRVSVVQASQALRGSVGCCSACCLRVAELENRAKDLPRLAKVARIVVVEPRVPAQLSVESTALQALAVRYQSFLQLVQTAICLALAQRPERAFHVHFAGSADHHPSAKKLAITRLTHVGSIQLLRAEGGSSEKPRMQKASVASCKCRLAWSIFVFDALDPAPSSLKADRGSLTNSQVALDLAADILRKLFDRRPW
mmetsp:Transcript_20110/g.47899  ORF Transcript_20110/g.47899 Transcript_20110/m.47899 type:complete len:214 (-) Transcript_20110:151-792(-)